MSLQAGWQSHMRSPSMYLLYTRSLHSPLWYGDMCMYVQNIVCDVNSYVYRIHKLHEYMLSICTCNVPVFLAILTLGAILWEAGWNGTTRKAGMIQGIANVTTLTCASHLMLVARTQAGLRHQQKGHKRMLYFYSLSKWNTCIMPTLLYQQ